jgi:hypothetical protein
MNGKHIQFKDRSVISLLGAVLILVMAVSPVLAEEDVGGGSRPGQSQAAVLDEATGFLSLKASYHTSVSGGTSTFAQVTDEERGFISLKANQPSSSGAVASVPTTDEEKGYVSLQVARSATVTTGSPASVMLSDEQMGFLSLKGTQHLRPAPGLSGGMVADDETMGYFSLQVARQFYAGYAPQALALVQ